MAFINPSRTTKPIISFHLDPRTKILMILTTSILVVTINNIFFLLPLLEFLVYLSALSNLNFKKIWQYLKPTFWVSIPIFIIQVIFSPKKRYPLVAIPLASKIFPGFVLISSDGLVYATAICLRIFILAYSSCMFSLTTNSDDFLQSLTKIGLPFELAFTTGLVIYFYPMVVSESLEVKDSLETRGISLTNGRLRDRLNCFKVLVSAILMNFLEKSKYQAIAMDSRGFNPNKKRTSFRELHYKKRDVLFTIMTLVLAGGMLYLFRDEINFLGVIFSKQ
ncbi:MAG: hypothetical protein GF308_11830 [Candidatus Heimdallarchaeota archaeon]|nr:hypothetical protein [Candidatus Heimdallarchaeota archaeon]